jgi:hypothetical protein
MSDNVHGVGVNELAEQSEQDAMKVKTDLITITSSINLDTVGTNQTSFTNQLSGASSSGLKTLITGNDTDISGINDKLDATTSSGLKTLIDNKVSMVLGTTSSTALAGNTTTITTSQANIISANQSAIYAIENKTDHISVSQAVNLDDMESDLLTVATATTANTTGRTTNATNITTNTNNITTNTNKIVAIKASSSQTLTIGANDESTNDLLIGEVPTSTTECGIANKTSYTAGSSTPYMISQANDGSIKLKGHAITITSAKDLDTMASNITTNNAKVSMVLGTSGSTALAGDTTTITSDQASAITANTAKTGITSTQATNITNNTTELGNFTATTTTFENTKILLGNGNGMTNGAGLQQAGLNSGSGIDITTCGFLQDQGGNSYMNAIDTKDLFFRINNVTKMKINSSGEVGIGTTSPGERLDVDNGGVIIRTPTNVGNSIGSSETALTIMRNGNSGEAYGTKVELKTNRYENSSTNARSQLDIALKHGAFSGAAEVTVMSLRSNGNVGIGTTSPSSTLRVDGDIHATGTSTSSDERIKENIQIIDDNSSLEKIRNIECYKYEYKDKSMGEGQTLGFLAQQVLTQEPLAVKKVKDFIPNEMRTLTPEWIEIKQEVTITHTSVADGWDGRNTTEPDLTEEEKGGVNVDEVKTIITYEMVSDLQGISGEKYKFITNNGNIEIVVNEDNKFIFDRIYDNLIVYGKMVDDFHTLDKNKLFALAFSALQQVDKNQQEILRRLDALES